MKQRDPWLLVLYIFAGLMGLSFIVFRIGWWSLGLTGLAFGLYCWLRLWRRP